jgi:hypothetical protein
VSRRISDCICSSLNFWSVDDAPTDSTASSNSKSDESSDLKEPGYIDTEIEGASPEGGASAPASSKKRSEEEGQKP